MQTGDLNGALLDFWVARAMGLNSPRLDQNERVCTYVDDQLSINMRQPFSPSTDWAHGGPVIARLNISTMYEPDSASYGELGTWTAYISR